MHVVYEPGWTHAFLWVVIVAFIVVFFLAFAMGANDCANSYGPAVGAGVLTLIQAYLCATVFEVLGAGLLGYKVTNTIRENIVNVAIYDVQVRYENGSYHVVDSCNETSTVMPGHESTCITYTNAEFMLGALGTVIGCATFMIGATVVKMPVSTTHSIVGATVGFSLVLKGGTGINWVTIGKIIASWVISPLLAGLFATIFYAFLKYCAFNREYPLESSLKTLPFLFWFTLFINVFSVLYGGSKYLRFNVLPVWADVLIAAGIGLIVAALVWFLAVNRIRKAVIEKMGERADIAQRISLSRTRSESAGSLASNLRFNVRKRQPVDPVSVYKFKSDNVWSVAARTQLDAPRKITKSLEAERPAAEMLHSPEEHVPFYAYKGIKRRLIDLWKPHLEPVEGSQVFASLQILSSCFLSFSHGSNDTANAVGPLVALWIAFKSGHALADGNEGAIEGLIIFGACSMIVGLWFLGHKVIQTVGKDLANITPASGFCIQMGTAFSVLIASQLSIPISTTHCVIGAIVILGYFRTRAGVNLKMFGNIAIAWLVTLPIAGAVSALSTYLLRFYIK